MKLIANQSNIIDIDKQIELLKEICEDLRGEYNRQLKALK